MSAARADTRVVLINGARQVGKSTLVRAVAGDRDAEWRDLDLPPHRQSAFEDPVGFVSFDGFTVIDEIQRVPDLLLAIKANVDADPRPGRFLLTGSSRLLGPGYPHFGAFDPDERAIGHGVRAMSGRLVTRAHG